MRRPDLDTIAQLPVSGLDSWLLWRYMAGKGGKLRKQPVDPLRPHTALAKWQHRNWSFVAIADVLRDLWRRNAGTNLWGIGFNVQHSEHPYVALDFDSPVSDRWMSLLASTYSETSPSGRGRRAWLQIDGLKPPGSRKFKNHEWSSLEVFVTTGFVTVTGHGALRPFRVVTAPSLADLLGTPQLLNDEHQMTEAPPYIISGQRGAEHLPPTAQLSDAEIIKRAHAAANGARFAHLWSGDLQEHGSHSEADMALCCHLAFWCGPDPARIDRVFRQSGLYRDKWERRDYRERTIAHAIDLTDVMYAPEADIVDPFGSGGEW